MRTKLYIRRFLAGFILVVFALSITPRTVLHSWFASHKDSGSSKSYSFDYQLSKSTYNCNCDNIVAESPFTGAEIFTEILLMPTFPLLEKVDVCTIHSAPFFLFTLRGPPVIS